MKIQKKSLILILVLMFSSLSLGIFGFAIATTAETTLPDYQPMSMGPEFRASNLPVYGEMPSTIKTSGGLHASPAAGDYYEVGDIIYWFALDSYYGYYYFTTYELRAMNDLAEIWVQTDLSYGWDIFGGTFPDPRDDPVITDEQVEYLLVEFTDTIYPIDTTYFGVPDLHDGSYSLLDAWGNVPPGYYNDSSREVILVSNVKDDAYYDPSYPYYIAGFYSPSFELYFDRNIISIDSHDWENRMGPDVNRPYLYEGVIAHEYQHLIHDDYFIESALWMNEGCSMYAEVLCGYPIDWSGINSFLYTPDNSLTQWGDQGDINILADYGQVLLWATYLVDNYGSTFLKDYVTNSEPGIKGVNDLLMAQGTTFDEVFYDWTLDNLLQTGYTSFDFNDPAAGEINFINIKKSWTPLTKGSSLGTTISILGYDTGISKLGQYGTDYLKFTKLRDKYDPLFYFDGDDFGGIGWERTNDMWYSTPAAALEDISIIGEFQLDSGASFLTFDTLYDIESYWDFGFVQISIDGESWVSLENPDTTYDHDTQAHDDIVANLPGLTGSSGGWTTMSFDISDYAGGTAFIRFRYMTDWAYEDPGWWVDNIYIDGQFIEDGFELDPPLPEADFFVTLIAVEEDDDGPKYKLIERFTPDDLTEITWDYLDSYIEKDGYVLAMISVTEGPADYKFAVEKTD